MGWRRLALLAALTPLGLPGCAGNSRVAPALGASDRTGADVRVAAALEGAGPSIEIGTTACLPRHWVVTGLVAATPLEEQNFEVTAASVRRAMAAYPHRLVAFHVDRVLLYETLTVNGRRIGSTVALGPNRLFLTGLHSTAPHSESFVEAQFHHEFCHVLWLTHQSKFPTEAWEALNPPGFKYLNSGHLEHGSHLGRKALPEFLEQGFLNEYATTAIEEDAAQLAEIMFTRSGWLLSNGADMPKVLRKVELLYRFYKSIDPEFTWAPVPDSP